jgi:hypothetical protein
MGTVKGNWKHIKMQREERGERREERGERRERERDLKIK